MMTAEFLGGSFLRSVNGSIIANALSVGLLLLTQLVLARTLGVEQYGIYAYAMSWLAVLTLASKGGMDVALQRFLPPYIANGRRGLCIGLLWRAYQVAAGSGILLAAVALPLTLIIVGRQQLLWSLVLALVALPILSAGKITRGALLALRHPVAAQVADGLVAPLVILTIALVAEAGGSVLTAIGALGATWLGAVLALLMGLWILRRVIPDPFRSAVAEFRTREWLRVSAPLFFVSGMHLIIGYADIVMLGMIRGTFESGIYAICTRLAAVVALPLMFVNAALAPYVSELWSVGAKDRLQHLTTSAVRIGATLGIPIALLLAVFPEAVLGLFGQAFVAGRLALTLLIVGQLVNVGAGPVALLMTMTGRHWDAAVVITGGAILNIVLNALLIPRFGMAGAAIATAASTILWNAGLAFLAHSRIGINSSVFAIRSRYG
ncbi:MAG: oligosaccharide flippase family protein [Pseudolabrys sp.]